jgi:hypothetical protein
MTPASCPNISDFPGRLEHRTGFVTGPRGNRAGVDIRLAPQSGAPSLRGNEMSLMGQLLPKWGVRATSALPLLPTIERTLREVRFVPLPEAASSLIA